MSYMISGNGRGKRKVRAAAMALAGTLALCGCFFGRGISCEAKETGAAAKQKTAAAKDEQEVIEFITAYGEAMFSLEEIETLGDYVDDPEDEEFQRELLRLRITLQHGFKGWKNREVVVCPLSDGKHWLVSAGGDMMVEEFDVEIPGANVYLVGRNEEGELKIILNGDTLPDELFKEMRELMTSDEMVDYNNEVTVAYNTLMEERPDITEWILETSEAIDEEMMEALKEPFSTKTDSGNGTLGAKKDGYTVKKGDCLWNIAEKQLGDGMLWSEIYDKNRDVIGEDPNLIYVGIELELR